MTFAFTILLIAGAGILLLCLTPNRADAAQTARLIVPRVCWATGLGPEDDTDVGQVVSRTLQFNKLRGFTDLRISYTDNMRVQGPQSPATGRWEIRIDGLPVPSGALVYDYGVDDPIENRHSSQNVVGFASGIPAGSHTIEIWVGDTSHPTADRYTGWQSSRWVIEVQEVMCQ